MASVYEAFWKNLHYFSWCTFGDDFKIVSVFSGELGSTADTCTASVYGAFDDFHSILVVVLWEMTSGLSPYSALSLVRHRIHALRQSMRLSGSVVFLWEMTEIVSVFSAELGSSADTCTASVYGAF